MAKRTFALKIVRFKVGRVKGFAPPLMNDLLERLFVSAPTVGQRHLPTPPPPPNTIQMGAVCFYINRGVSRSGRDGFMIECVCYVNGMAPEQTLPNFGAATLPISSVPIVDRATGQTKQVIHSYRALFLGQCAIIEVEKGGGGTATLALCLTALLRQHVQADLPAIEFMDVMSTNLRRSIRAAGGVERVSVKLATTTRSRRRPLSFRLSRLKDWAGNRAVVHADLEFPDGVHSEKAIQALDEYALDDGLESVTVYLRDGQKITGRGKFVEKRRMDVGLTPSGGYNVADVEDTMWNYLDEMRIPDENGWRLVDEHGRPVGAEVVGEDESSNEAD